MLQQSIDVNDGGLRLDPARRPEPGLRERTDQSASSV